MHLTEEKCFKSTTDIDYSSLFDDLRNNPDFFARQIAEFNATKNAINPISFAGAGALTKENINLALEKGGNINIYGVLRENELFHRLNIEKGSILVAYYLLPNSIKEDDNLMFLYIRMCPDEYSKLNIRQRNNAQILREALLRYDNLLGKVNPISYAKEGALTEENIDLALEKANIKIIKGSSLSNCKRFALKFFEDSSNISQYVFFSSELKSDSEVLNKALLSYDGKSGKVNPISYSEEGALTSENIDLALEKGNIKIIKGSSLSNNRYFVIESFRRGLFIYQYNVLSDILRSDSEVLKLALLNYDNKSGKVNPISYAKEGALTEENIDLALEKDNIEFEENSALLNNKYFVVEAFKRGKYISEYNNISDTLKKDQDVIALKPHGIIGVSIGEKKRWAPSGSKQVYKYFQALIEVLPDGYNIEEEVRGGSKRSFSHTEAIQDVVDDFCKENPNDIFLGNLKDALERVDNPFIAANMCSSYGIFVIMIEGECCQLFFPESLSIEQYDILMSNFNTDFKNLQFEICYNGKIYEKYYEKNGEKYLSVDDVKGIINTYNLVSLNVQGRKK